MDLTGKFIVLLIVMIISLLVFSAGHSVGRGELDKFKEEAVARGFAEFHHTIYDDRVTTEWRWK